MKEQRRLAAIMFTDIVGYTSTMSEDEQKALEILQRNRDVLKPAIAGHKGEWLKEMGDGTLSSFTSAVEAVNCALEIQRSLKDETNFKVRIGIHIGDVVISESDIFGSGVNVASRIEPLAEPGGICISERVFDDISNRPDIETAYMGEKSLKNVGRPIRVYALWGEGLPKPYVERTVIEDTEAVKIVIPTTIRKVTIGVAAISVLSILIVGFLTYFFLGRSPGSEIVTIGNTRQITIEPGLEVDPALSPAGNTLAYASNASGQFKLFIRQVAGGRINPLTEEFPGNHRWPQWSPDGTEIAFFSEKGIYTIPALYGGTPKLKVNSTEDGQVRSPAWSPNGKQLAYVQGGRFINVLTIEDEKTENIAEIYRAHSLSWFPEGSHIALVSGNPFWGLGNQAPSSIWVVPVTDGEPIPMIENGAMNISPVLSPEGTNLFFVSDVDGKRDVHYLPLTDSGTAVGMSKRLTTGLNASTISLSGDGNSLAYSVYTYKQNIWSVGITKGEPVLVSNAKQVTTGNQVIEGIDVSSDGEWIAFDSNLTGNPDIYRMNLSNDERERLTMHPADDFLPSWSQDNQQIVFYSFRTGNRDIFTMTADGRTKLQLTNDPGADHYPDWSPDGENVVFQSDRTGRYELYILSKEISSSGWSSPEQLTFDGGVFGKWSPDGSLIAFNSGTDRYSGQQQGEESIKVIPPGGGDSDKLVSTEDRSVFPAPLYPSWSKDSRTIYFKARDEKRQASFWSVPVEGGTPTQLVIFDDPSRNSFRQEYATDGQRFFFTLTENESDISLLELLTNN